jgi:hypothetical protein
MKHLSKIAILLIIVVLSSCGLKRKQAVVTSHTTTFFITDTTGKSKNIVYTDPAPKEPSIPSPTTKTVDERQRETGTNSRYQ